MSLLAVRESGPLASRQVETFLLAQGAAFDLSGDIALNTAHREIIAGNPHGTSTIDYKNPIVLTGSITPNNGDFFTTDSKLLTITGSGGEKFWPNGGATSRIIWGASSGVALPVEINPSSLGVGGVFEIAIDDGESRKIRYDGTDFVKIGGIEIPMFFEVYASIQQTGLTSGAYVQANLDTILANEGDTFSGAPDYEQTIKRPGKWTYTATGAAASETSGALERVLPRIFKNNNFDKSLDDSFPVSAAVGLAATSPGGAATILTTIDDVIDLRIFCQTSSGTWRTGATASPLSAMRMEGLEGVGW